MNLVTLAHGDHDAAAQTVAGFAAAAPFVAGLAAGAIHVLTGPDHLAAVAPLAIEPRDRTRRPWLAGLCWGVGHSGGVWILALLALLFREAVPLDLISGWSERLVGLVLIGIGLWACRAALRTRVHAHEHTHDGETHTHLHAHPARHIDHTHHVSHHPAHARHTHAPLGIGLLHGLAGTSHLVGVLPSLLMPTRADAAAYVLAYGLGSIAAMTGFAHALGLVLNALGGERALRGMLTATGAAAVAVGLWWIVA